MQRAATHASLGEIRPAEAFDPARPKADLVALVARAEQRAAGLGNRLLDVEARTLDLRLNLGRARRELEQARAATGTQGGWFDIPRTQHDWPLAADTSPLDPSITAKHAPREKYDCRVDDPVIVEGRRGKGFLARFGLTEDAPDYATALTFINTINPRLHVCDDASTTRPDVSIVIPIYGALDYTLNVMDSLLAHVSRYSVEIIIIDDCSPDRSQEILSRMAHVRYRRQPRNGGFIASCNSGGAVARGRFVLLLNNDTRVADGWLDALIDSFAMFPRAGLVGSKMFYADGSLQEAGGIIWRDASCWNYGRNDDPNRPQYAHARQVDYISGCSIVLPIELWRALGGFDPAYAPAYCEDADLCLRVVRSGREVWLQPQSRLVHYEGKTSGTDTATGVKAYQVINSRKLYLRWRDRLEAHRPNAEAPYQERERAVRRRMLVVDATAPTPGEDAGSVQTMLGLQVCADLGYKSHFVADHNWLFQERPTGDLLAMGVECAYAPYDLGFESYIQRYGHLFDVVLAYRMGVLEPIAELIRRHAPRAALLFHVADLHFLRRAREAQVADDPAGLREAAAIKQRELALVSLADCTITHSTVEAEILAAEVPGAPVVVWPLMFAFHGTKVARQHRRHVCFLGGYRHPPNVDAVLYFVAEILPRIRRSDPSVKFLVAGSNPTPEILGLTQDGVEVLGRVEDLRDLFDRARVFVCPLRAGAGVKGKVVASLSYGLPVVSTSVGVEGAGLQEGRHVLVADDPQKFADLTLRLYNTPRLWNALSANGQELVRRDFSTEMGCHRLKEAIAMGYAHKAGLSAVAPALELTP